MKKQARTLRSKRWRVVLWESAKGVCQICGKGLGRSWHIDHIIPWKISGRTNQYEMQAVCAVCNLRKGSIMQVDLSKTRPGQRLAITEIIRRIVAGEKFTSVVLPTRYGKSDVIRLSSLQLYADQSVSGSMVLSPGGDLRSQIVRKSKLQEMCRRYEVPYALAKKVHELKHTELNPLANDIYLLSTTIQYANRNREDIARLIDSRVHQTGLPFIVFVDETHMVSKKNQWGKSISAFVDAGALAVLLTATADRADLQEIPGFTYETILRRDQFKKVKTRKGDIVEVDLYKGTESLISIKADVSITFKQAWDEDPSPLCTLSRDLIDVNLRQIIDSITAEDDQLLSELSPSQARMVIGKAVRDERVMRKGVAMFVEELRRAKAVEPELAGIIFTGHDQDSDSESNGHANAVRAMIEEQSQFECIVATSNCEDDTVSNHLQKFESGRGDVLIVKNAGGAGFDCSRLKVLLDLSSVRTFSSTVQRIMRVATPHGKITNAIVITLADILMSAIWESVVTESGGEWIDGNYDLVNHWEEPPGDGPSPRRSWQIEGSEFGSYDDILGKSGDMVLRPEVEKLLSMFPVIGTVHTKPAIAEILKGGSKNEVFGETFDEEIKARQSAIIAHMDALVKVRRQGKGYDASEYRREIKQCYSELFEAAQLDVSEIRSITDIEALKTLERAAADISQAGGVVWQ